MAAALGFFELVMGPMGVNHRKKFLITTLYFLALSVAVFFVYKPEVTVVVSRIDTTGWTLGVAFLMGLLAAHFIIRKYLQAPTTYIAKNPKLHFLPFDYRHFVTNTTLAFFQQILIAGFVVRLHNAGVGLFSIILILLIAFVPVHSGLIPKIGKGWAIYFMLASAIGAVLFPLLILKFSNGLVYSFLAHKLFYLVSGLWVWIYGV